MTQHSSNPPLIAIVGRPNVGKSTLFNRLTGQWRVMVEDRPGVTRDRLYGHCQIDGHELTIMDTGGLQVDAKTKVEKKMSEQAFKGIQEADFILFVLDGRDGVTPLDKEWIQKIRKIKKPKLFVINKMDDQNQDVKAGEFYELGVVPLVLISAEHRRNFSEMAEQILKGLGLNHNAYAQMNEDEVESDDAVDASLPKDVSDKGLSIAISGRPNVGKSTLLNALLKDERCIVDDVPGTTRDPIDSIISHKGKTYRFIDTAGIRKRARSEHKIETVSVMQSLKVVDEADIVLLLIDGVVGPTEQDAHVAGYAFEKDKAIILIVNKWDEGSKKYTREEFEDRLELKMNYLNHCPVLYISAKTQKNLSKIYEAIEDIRKQYERKISTSELNKAFEHIIDNHPLPVFKGQQIKMFYATQVGSKPPTFMVFCNYPKNIHFSYTRYLINALREIFEFNNIPVRVLFKER